MDTSLGPREAAKVGVDRSIGRSIDRCRAGCWEGEGEGTVATRSVAMLGVVRAGAGKGRGSANGWEGRGAGSGRSRERRAAATREGRRWQGCSYLPYSQYTKVPRPTRSAADSSRWHTAASHRRTGKRRKEERVPLAKMAGNRLLHGPRVLFLTVVVSVCFFAVFVISPSSSSRVLDRSTDRLDRGSLRESERERGREGEKKGGKEGDEREG